MLNVAVNSPAWYAEWTLIIFTVLAQFSVGTALFATFSSFFAQAEVAKKLCRDALVLMAVAGLVSFLHLQSPLNAPYVISQVGHSWLSREVLSLGIFFVLVLLQYMKPSKFFALVSSLVGLFLVYAMSQVYASMTSMVLWNTSGTAVAFYGTSFALGGAIALWRSLHVEAPCLKKLASSMMLFGIALSLVAKSSWIGVFMQGDVLTVPANFACAFVLQTIFVVLGLLALLLRKERPLSSLMFLGVLCLVMAELASRTVFFVAQLKIGV